MPSTRPLLLSLCLLSFVSACSETPPEAEAPLQQAATYVGSETCAGCHQAVFDEWQSSHHAAAMQVATPDTVLADIGADGSPLTGSELRLNDASDSERLVVTHTFGIAPLQQYLVDLPDGRKQALTTAWDDRPSASGGQRWFSLYPDVEGPDDVLHWRRRAHTWNQMCADCHSTALRKGYDAENNRYDTQSAEIAVGCEACHGPGSLHADEPTAITLFSPRREHPRSSVETCAPCHARRSQLTDGHVPGADSNWLNAYRPAFLNPPLYFPDGQIRDEVYVYGSFMASRMAAAGVVCQDCHDAHTGKVASVGDGLCVRCHNPSGDPRFPKAAGTFASEAHHGHPTDSAGARCVACHMPETTYMRIDPRRDHSFVVPGASPSAQNPSPCASCHAGETQNPETIAGHPRTRFASNTEDALLSLVEDPTQPAMLRASALIRLADGTTERSRSALRAGFRDEDPLVRLAAVAGLRRLGESQRVRALRRAFQDPLLAIRLDAFHEALNWPHLVDGIGRSTYLRVREEYLASLAFNADTPEAMVARAQLAQNEGSAAEAERHLKQALVIAPGFIPAKLALAAIYERTGQTKQAEVLLRTSAMQKPRQAEAVYAYAMWLVRNGEGLQALEQLKQLVSIAPDEPHWRLTLAIALNDYGGPEDARIEITNAIERWPENRDLLLTAATLFRDSNDLSPAARYAQRLVELAPGEPAYRRLLSELKR